MKVPKNTVASIILKWKKFETTKKLSNRGRSALFREVNKNPVEIGEPSRISTMSAALRPFMVECPDGN